MRRALKLLLLIGIGLALAGKKDGPGGTPGNFDKVDIPAKYKGLEGNSTLENQAEIDRTLGKGEPTPSNSGETPTGGDGSGDATADNVPPNRSDLPPLNITPKQFGKKWGKHAEDYDWDPADPESRQKFQDLADEVHSSPDDVRVGPYNPNGGGGTDYVFFQKGDDILIMKPNGDFVTMFPKGDRPNFNQWYLEATPIQ